MHVKASQRITHFLTVRGERNDGVTGAGHPVRDGFDRGNAVEGTWAIDGDTQEESSECHDELEEEKSIFYTMLSINGCSEEKLLQNRTEF